MLRHQAVAGSYISAHQAQAGVALGVHRDHRVRHHAVRIPFLHRPQAAAALRGGREFHLRGILNRQPVPPGGGRAGQIAPSLDNSRRRYFRVGEKPTRSQFATTVTTQPAQADRLARDHSFEDRTPPLSRRRSPNDPSDHSISAPVLRLPGWTESYSRRVGQEIFSIDAMANMTCVHALVRRRGPATHDVPAWAEEKTWMARPSPAMTRYGRPGARTRSFDAHGAGVRHGVAYACAG